MPITGLSGPLAGEGPELHVFDFKERKDQMLLAGAEAFEVSRDGKKLLYSAPGGGEDGAHTYGIIDAAPVPSPHKTGEGALNLAGNARGRSILAHGMEADVQ